MIAAAESGLPVDMSQVCDDFCFQIILNKIY